MIELLPLAVGLGLLVSVLLSETLGIVSAGMVVPGYVALYLNAPRELFVTALATLATFAVVRGVARFVILFGRRRAALAIVTGYLLGTLLDPLLARYLPGLSSSGERTFGFVVPGLIALWMDRQGTFSTIAALLTSASLVRLLLIAFGVALPLAEVSR